MSAAVGRPVRVVVARGPVLSVETIERRAWPRLASMRAAAQFLAGEPLTPPRAVRAERPRVARRPRRAYPQATLPAYTRRLVHRAASRPWPALDWRAVQAAQRGASKLFADRLRDGYV